VGVAARFIVLYGLLYGAFGVRSPFMPRFFESRGLSPDHIGLLFGLGTFVRLFSGPIAGRADLLGMLADALALSGRAQRHDPSEVEYTWVRGAASLFALVHASGIRRRKGNTVPRHGTPGRWKEPSRAVLIFVLDPTAATLIAASRRSSCSRSQPRHRARQRRIRLWFARFSPSSLCSRLPRPDSRGIW